MLDAIILVGGFGTRLQKVVSDVPKPLAPIQGTPFLDLLIKQLTSFPLLDRIVLAVGYKAESIIKRYQNSNDPIYFSIEKTPLGTGGALKRALSLCKSSTILAMNGDCYTEYQLADFYEDFQKKKADISLLTYQVEDTKRYGTLQMEEKTFRIHSFLEKAASCQSGWISCGTYLMKRKLFEKLPFQKESFSLEKEVFPHFLKKAFYAYPCSGTFIDIGTEQSFQQAQTLLSNLCALS